MDGLWKLRAEPWVALDGPRKGRLEAITLWASQDGQNPGLFLQNNAELLTHLSQLLSSSAVAHSILTTLTQNQPINLPGEFTTTQLRNLGFEI